MNTVELRSKGNTLRIHMGEGSMLMATWAIIQQPHYVLVTILRIPFLLKWKEEKVLHTKEIRMIT